jgi:hypothetical protein
LGEETLFIDLTGYMERKEKKSFFDTMGDMDPKIFIGLLAVSGVLFGAVLGSLLLRSDKTTSKVPPTPTVKDPFAVSTAQLILPTRATTTSMDSIVPTEGGEVNQFLAETQTAAALPATAAPESTATESTASEGQSPTTVVITATPDTGLPGTLDSLASQPVLLNDTFDDDGNGWTPFASTGFAVSMDEGMMQIFFSEPSFNPFLWTCDACGTFDRYSYQVDVKLPTDSGTAIAGLVFGSPTRIDQLPFEEAYALSIYSSGEMVLQHISASSIEVIEKWDKYHSQFTPDGSNHTLQVLANGNKAAIYIDGKSLGGEIELTTSSAGYIGLVVQSTNQTVYFDNLKVIALP